MWTNAALQKVINDKGKRINSIALNNGKYIFFGYNSPNSASIEDIRLETHDGVDVIVIPHEGYQYDKKVKWESWVTTEFIEGIDILDSGFENQRLYPLSLK